MPRSSTKSIEGYAFEGKYAWKDALKDSKGLGVLTTFPCEEMISEDGFTKTIGHSASQTYIEVVFDKEFVHEFLHRRIVLAMGFMRGDTFNVDGFNRFMAEQVTYSLEENKRNGEAEMIRIATELVTTCGKDFDFWHSVLKEKAASEESANSANQTQEDRSLVSAANGKTKAKV